MDTTITSLLEQSESIDNAVRLEAFTTLLKLTEEPVDWVYEAWDGLAARLDHPNSYQRSIGLMLLCNLAQSDRECRTERVVASILAHTRDEKFITSRQCLQSCWKIGWFLPALRQQVVDHLARRFAECAGEKHSNLLRQDVVQSLYTLYQKTQDQALLDRIHALIESETEAKNRKAYLFIIKS